MTSMKWLSLVRALVQGPRAQVTSQLEPKNLLLFTLEVQGPEVTTAISKVTARGEKGQL